MLKQDYTETRFEIFIKETEAEYGSKYTSQLKEAWNELKPNQTFQPTKILRKIKEADPEYREGLAMILASRNQALGDFHICCGED